MPDNDTIIYTEGSKSTKPTFTTSAPTRTTPLNHSRTSFGLNLTIATLFILITTAINPLDSRALSHITKLVAHAGTDCNKLTDLDDKAKCYAEKIDDKQSEYKSTSKQLDELAKAKTNISSKLTGLSSQLNLTQADLQEVQDQINEVQKQLTIINQNLTDRRTKLNDKMELRRSIIRTFAMKAPQNELERLFFSGLISGTDQSADNTDPGTKFLDNLATQGEGQAYSENLLEKVVQTIGGLNSEIDSFESDKAKAESIKADLQTEQNKLTAMKNDLAAKANQAKTELDKTTQQEQATKNKLNDLQKQINDLSAKQQEILKQKAGEGSNSIGDYAPPTASTPDPPFKPAFAGFSYGAYTHYNGMSQYGAKGRADKGQNYKEILKFYYKSDTTKKSDFPSKINVQGYGELDFQYYLYGLAEMPTNWPLDALKAQAVAGRTYGYKAGKPICTTESCQVFSKSKADKVKNGEYPTWKKAVDETKGEILSGSSTSQYSSTTGGYINNVGWDTKGKWPGDAYEKIGGSPWFYKAWYTKGYSGSDSCGRGHPWMSEKEMADILNSWVVWDKGTSEDEKHISPISCWGGDPYSMDEMASKADKYGTKYSKVSNVDVDIGSNGQTTKVTLSTDQGTVSIDGTTFRSVFNLRAPGYVSLKSRLYDFENRK